MIKFKKRLGICMLGTLLTAAPGYARQMSLDEAIRHASGNLMNHPSRSMSELLYTEQTDDLNVAYILSGNDGEGYVVISADDLLPAVLGYSDSGRFDAASIPPAMASWMQEYGRQLQYAVDNGLRPSDAATTPDHKPIAPLCSAIWSQNVPFNDNTPIINGKHSPAGCTATAMAQVMYAHKWPLTGTGVNTYNSGNLTFDFGATTFDWDNMLPVYSAGYTATQGAAVAKLLEACGNASLMSYGASASGAYPYDAIYGMVNFLKYDKSATILWRDYYTSARWDELVYNELAAGRPVIYGGYTADYTSGHTFVVDGYSTDGYYHLNWGWAGLSNGYFLLTALDPDDQGTGGSSSGYNYNQDAIINVMPEREGSQYQLEIFWNGAFTTELKSYAKNGTIRFIVGPNGSYTGSNLTTLEPTIGINLTPVDGGETVFYPGSKIKFEPHYGLTYQKSYKDFYVSAANLPTSGEYIATPAFKLNDEVKEVAVRTGMVNVLKLTLTRTGVRIEEISVVRNLTADNVEMLTPMYSGKSCKVSADIHNAGIEYHGMVKAGFANAEGDVLSWLGDVPVSVPDGKSVSVNFSGKLVRRTDGSPLATGDYKLGIYDESGTLISTPVDVVVIEAPEGKPSFDMDISVSGALSGDGTVGNPYIVEDQIKVDITFDVFSGLLDENVTLYAYYYGDSTGVNFSGENTNSKTFYVGPGMSQTQTYTVGTAYFEPDRTVYIRPYGWTDNGWFSKRIFVKHVTSGISEISADGSGIYPNPAVNTTTVSARSVINGIDVYSITGTKVMCTGDFGSERAELDITSLQPGHYIVIVKTADGTESHRLIKR